LRGLASIVAGRRSKWVVLVFWIIAIVVMLPVGSKLSDETTDDTESFLPNSAESTEVVRQLDQEFSAGETTFGLIVYQDKNGLSAEDRQKIAADAQAIQAAGKDKVPLTQPPTVPFAPGSPSNLVSSNGEVAYTVLNVPTNFDEQGKWGKNVRDITGESAGDMQIYVTGDLGFSADADEVFSDIDTRLLLATVLLVLVLLGAIYRAVLIAITPLIVVGFAYIVATGFIYLYANSGATVSSNSTAILIVLMFGVGTDYCLLLVSRYREELRRLEDKHDAMQRALRRSGPAILASGLTVSLAMLVLALADAGNTSSLGPVAAIAVFCAMVGGLTLLPTLLTIFGRVGFWPRRSVVVFDPEHPSMARQGLWRRFGDRVLERPGAALTVTVTLFAAGALGLLAYKVDYSTTSFFKGSVESVEGFEVLRGSFPAGVLAPSTVLVERNDGPVTQADIEKAVQTLSEQKGVARVTPTGLTSDDGRIASLNLILEGDPLKVNSLDLIP